MDKTTINTTSFSFIGLFSYSDEKLEKYNWKNIFEACSFYSENKDYFQQKYYDNWLNSIFCDVSSNKLKSNHLKIKNNHELLSKNHVLKFTKENLEVALEYIIRDIEIFLFPNNLGLFLIKIDLPKHQLNWQHIIDFAWEFRKTTVNQKYNEIPHSVELIEKHIVNNFSNNKTNWRKYNPSLKTGFYIDIKEKPETKELDDLLFSVGTFVNPYHTKTTYNIEASYKDTQINNASISIYSNWKTLCLYDTLTRIAVNLNEEDKYKLWGNEYVLIYVYVIYSRFYLHSINTSLTDLSSHSKNLIKTRDNFLKFINDYSHSKISYKFLPNEIYKQLKKSLDIDEEVQSIQEKITRMNDIRQERNEKKLSRILTILTFLTLISVAYDGGQWLGHKEDINAFYISTIIFLSVVMVLLIVYLFKRK